MITKKRSLFFCAVLALPCRQLLSMGDDPRYSYAAFVRLKSELNHGSGDRNKGFFCESRESKDTPLCSVEEFPPLTVWILNQYRVNQIHKDSCLLTSLAHEKASQSNEQVLLGLLEKLTDKEIKLLQWIQKCFNKGQRADLTIRTGMGRERLAQYALLAQPIKKLVVFYVILPEGITQ